MGYKEQIEEIKTTIGEKKLEEVRLKERQRKNNEEGDAVAAELKTLGIGSDYDEWLKKEEVEIKAGLKECNEVLAGK
jgi:hypothetical protein